VQPDCWLDTFRLTFLQRSATPLVTVRMERAVMRNQGIRSGHSGTMREWILMALSSMGHLGLVVVIQRDGGNGKSA